MRIKERFRHRRRSAEFCIAIALILLDASAWGQTSRGFPTAAGENQSAAPTWESFNSEPRIAIVVGVNKYEKDSGFTPLHQAVNDANALYKVLQSYGYKGPDENSEYPILNEAATKTRLKYEIERALRILNGHGTLIFFFSGHGMEDKTSSTQYLAPYGVDKEDLANSGIPVQDIIDKLKVSSVPRKVLFIDACREPSKDDQPQKKGDIGTPPPPPYFSKYLSAKGILTLYASSPGKPSFEDDKLGHGIFSKFLIDGLTEKAKGLNGLITFDRLAEFVQKSVKQVRSDQEPTISTVDRSQDFILGGTLENADLPGDFSDEELKEAGKKYYSERYFSQARSLQNDGKLADARKKLDVALHLDPGNNEARSMRVALATSLRDSATVSKDCTELIAQLPKSEQLRVDCALRFAAFGQHATAVRWLSDALQLSPNNPAYLFKRAQSREALHLYRDALLDLQNMPVSPGDSEAATEIAIVHLLRGENDEAAKLIPKDIDGVLQIYPRLALDWVIDDKPGALKDALRAIWLRWGDEEVYFSACETRIWAGEIESGVLQCRIGADLASDEAYGLARLGIAQMLAVKKSEATKTSVALDNILKNQQLPQSETLSAAAVLFNLIGSYDRALEIADRFAALFAELPDPALHKAYALGKLGKTQEGLALVNKLIAEADEFGPAYRVRAQLRSALGDIQGAQSDEAEAKRLNSIINGSYY